MAVDGHIISALKYEATGILFEIRYSYDIDAVVIAIHY